MFVEYHLHDANQNKITQKLKRNKNKLKTTLSSHSCEFITKGKTSQESTHKPQVRSGMTVRLTRGSCACLRCEDEAPGHEIHQLARENAFGVHACLPSGLFCGCLYLRHALRMFISNSKLAALHKLVLCM